MKKVLALLFIFLSAGYYALGCGCSHAGSFTEVSKSSDLTFVGTITANKKWRLKVTVENVLIGKTEKKTITVIGDKTGASCLKVVKFFEVGKKMAFALYKRDGKYYLSGCGTYYLEIDNGAVKGIITDDFMIYDGSRWPSWNKKTMPEDEFYNLFKDHKEEPPCRPVRRYKESNILAAKAEKEIKKFEGEKEVSNFYYRGIVLTALEDNNLPLVEYLIENTGLLEKKDLDEYLFYSIEYGVIDIVNLLFDNNVSPTLSSSEGQTHPIFKAVLYPELVKELHSKGAKLNPKVHMILGIKLCNI